MASLTERLFDDSDKGTLDPFALFEDWFASARETEPNDPNAMALATVDALGAPDVRMVLLNARDTRGFCFFTNFGSDKGRQLLANPRAALLFHWKSQRRQVRLRGPVVEVSPEEADAYFATRARGSRIGANVSDQSRPLAARGILVEKWRALERELEGREVSRPDFWSGFRLVPETMEFWQDGQFRLHDRVRFTREADGGPWSRQRLYP